MQVGSLTIAGSTGTGSGGNIVFDRCLPHGQKNNPSCVHLGPYGSTGVMRFSCAMRIIGLFANLGLRNRHYMPRSILMKLDT